MFRALRSFTMNGKRISRYDLLESVPSHLQGTYLRARFIEPSEAPKGPSLSKLSKAELLAVAADMDITVPSGLKVADIRTLLKET